LDTARFCGNCGTPFPRTPAPSSSLVNCAQGHIYSAVYEQCPYCPQTEPKPTGDFATQVENFETMVENVSVDLPPPPPPPPSGEFTTKVESAETVFEPVNTFAPGSPNTVGPSEEKTKIQVDQPTRVESPEPTGKTPAKVKTPVDLKTPTEVKTPVDLKTPEEPVAPPPPPPPRPTRDPAPADRNDRRTIVMTTDEMAGESRAARKGKLIGWLVTYTPNQDGRDYRLLAGYNRIGANPACDLVIEDETVSGSHALIVYRDGRCLIKDELSRNGTFVNDDEVIESRVLQNYDQIRVGNTILTYVSAERPA
jgi:predicted component of type VI protein secretion system